MCLSGDWTCFKVAQYSVNMFLAAVFVRHLFTGEIISYINLCKVWDFRLFYISTEYGGNLKKKTLIFNVNLSIYFALRAAQWVLSTLQTIAWFVTGCQHWRGSESAALLALPLTTVFPAKQLSTSCVSPSLFVFPLVLPCRVKSRATHLMTFVASQALRNSSRSRHACLCRCLNMYASSCSEILECDGVFSAGEW